MGYIDGGGSGGGSLPASARTIKQEVANQAARFALTTTEVQQGDFVYQSDTDATYLVVDETELDSEAGYLLVQPAVDDLLLTLTDESILDAASLEIYAATGSERIEGSVTSDVDVSLVWEEDGRIYRTAVLAGRSVPFSYPQFGDAATLTLVNDSGSTATVNGTVYERTRFD